MSRRNDSVYLVVAILLSLIVERSALGEQKTDAEELSDRIQAIRKNNDPDTVRQLIADVEATGKVNKDEGYFRTVLALCEGLNSWVPTDRRRSEMAWRRAMDAINAEGEKPFYCEAKLLIISQFDWGDTTVVPPGTDWKQEASLRGADWQTERLRRLNQTLTVWEHLQAAKKNLPAVIGPIQITMWPPQGVPNARENMDPKEIEDPVLRQQYEKACAENAERAHLVSEKRTIENLELGFRFPAKCYLVDAYGKPPFDTEELESALAASNLDEKFVREVVGEVKKRVAQRIERDAKMASRPGTVRYIEIPPRGTRTITPTCDCGRELPSTSKRHTLKICSQR